eukprot:3282093-Pyramimonas_sp.AAC.1
MRSPKSSNSIPNCLKTTRAPANAMNMVNGGAPRTPPLCRDRKHGNGVRALAFAGRRTLNAPRGAARVAAGWPG